MIVNVNGTFIHYIEHGQSNGLPLVFLHGFPFSGAMWQPQLNSLPDSVRAVAPDIRGSGASDVGDGQYTIDLFVDDLIALLDYLQISKAVLCGLSMGGYIAQRALQRRPDLVQGLILCNTKSEADTDEAKINRANSIRNIKLNGIPAFSEEYLKHIFSPETFANNAEAVILIKNIIESTSLLGLCGTQLALAARTDTTSLFSSLNIPVLFLAGALDLIVPPGVMKVLQKKVWGSEFHILPNSAHISNLEDTTEFNRILLEFLKKYWHV
jgi:pimeloyl-ACP methyl ester carboxylesterase